MDDANQYPPTQEEGASSSATNAASSGGDPWASSTATGATGEEALTHNEGETFTMPETNNTAAAATRKDEIISALSNLGSVISAKAREVDQQAGISTKVADVNERYHVSEKWGNLTEATRQKTQEINERYHVADKWTNFRGTVAARVEEMKENRRKRLEETGGEGTNNNNLAEKLNGASMWVSQRIQGIRTGGSVDENDRKETELRESN